MKVMKKWFALACSLLLVLVMAACSSGKDQAAGGDLDAIKKRGKLIVGVKYDTRLFGYKDPADNQVKGFEVDLMRELAKKLFGDPNKVEFKEVTSKTRIKMLTSGDIDLIAATMTITEERKKQVDFSHVYYMAGQSLLVPKNSSIKTVKDAKGKKVSTAKGATSGKNLEKYVPGVIIEEYDNYADAFTALKSKKVDAVTTDDSILLGMAESDNNYVVLPEKFTEEPYGLGIKKGNEQLKKFVNEFLDEVQKNGKYRELYKKWFKKEPPANLPKDAVQKHPK
ncbi:putative glutamine transport system substrate-binding protein [Thermoflavimicrobium dichotomicum]|uniref:Putative glutamine transport system substrate-binding protein n=2 Tax=Thermoflavimicrobium dichotomicum TaxID=46223 RepID=A0A1I3JHR2_9BACL|nr:glutamate ABC transporter substrate-binding protein [Thermoflavimicrobium dichotomicum]SFI59706.1 putative glutamine transport system substrate-binding protein [Thermoflavimicrobium dichotomicum]